MPFGSSRFGSKDGTDAASQKGVDVVFTTGLDGVEILWKGTGGEVTMGGGPAPNQPYTLNSFHGHVFVARRRGRFFGEFTVDGKGANRFLVVGD